MKLIHSFLVFALMGSGSFANAATPVATTAPSVNLSIAGTPDELIALERQKVDYIFGTPEEKHAALRLFAKDFVNIATGPGGPQWEIPDLEAHMKLFPTLPAGTFTMTEIHVTPLARGCCVVSYKIAGPGPDGKPWTALNSSTWVKRGREWKTVFYQASLISGS